jgi:preprotein translocase subunit SecG
MRLTGVAVVAVVVAVAVCATLCLQEGKGKEVRAEFEESEAATESVMIDSIRMDSIRKGLEGLSGVTR